MYAVPKEALLVLISETDPFSLPSLSSSDKTLNSFLRDPYVLEQLGIFHRVPTPKNVSDLQKLLKMTPERKLQEASKRGDVASVLRMVALGAKNYDWAIWLGQH